MTEIQHLREEIEQIEGEIRRLRGSFNKSDNGEKIRRITVLTRTLERLNRSLATHEKRAAEA